MQERVIVGIDVGTTKICVLVGELDRDGKLNIVGVGTCPSQGLRRGVYHRLRGHSWWTHQFGE